MKVSPRADVARRAFTLMELMTVIIIISILSLMAFSAVTSLRGKAERGRCVNNLQGLYAAGVSYVTDHESWPQIPRTDINSTEFAKAWIEAFRPYHIGQINWTCGALQKALGNPPLDPENPQIDYLPTAFDNRVSSPWRFSTHPWFIEKADAHGEGNLIIFANGQVHAVNDLQQKN